ncbi:MAG: hypothetical protein V3V62_12020, partial [bacterium]
MTRPTGRGAFPPAAPAPLIGALTLLLGALAPPPWVLAHHTSRIGYVLQRVGEKTVGDFSVELISTPPKAPAREKKANSPSGAAAAGLRVRLRFTRGGWEKTFPLPPEKEGAFAANLALGPKGAYEVAAEIAFPPSGRTPRGGSPSSRPPRRKGEARLFLRDAAPRKSEGPGSGVCARS